MEMYDVEGEGAPAEKSRLWNSKYWNPACWLTRVPSGRTRTARVWRPVSGGRMRRFNSVFAYLGFPTVYNGRTYCFYNNNN